MSGVIAYALGDIIELGTNTVDSRQRKFDLALYAILIAAFVAYTSVITYYCVESYMNPSWSPNVDKSDYLEFPEIVICPGPGYKLDPVFTHCALWYENLNISESDPRPLTDLQVCSAKMVPPPPGVHAPACAVYNFFKDNSTAQSNKASSGSNKPDRLDGVAGSNSTDPAYLTVSFRSARRFPYDPFPPPPSPSPAPSHNPFQPPPLRAVENNPQQKQQQQQHEVEEAQEEEESSKRNRNLEGEIPGVDSSEGSWLLSSLAGHVSSSSATNAAAAYSSSSKADIQFQPVGIPSLVKLFAPGTANRTSLQHSTPSFVASTGVTYFVSLMSTEERYKGGDSVQGYTAWVSSSAGSQGNGLNANDVTILTFTFSSFDVSTTEQYIAFNWLSLLAAIGGAAAMVKLIHYLVTSLVFGCCCRSKQADEDGEELSLPAKYKDDDNEEMDYGDNYIFGQKGGNDVTKGFISKKSKSTNNGY